MCPNEHYITEFETIVQLNIPVHVKALKSKDVQHADGATKVFSIAFWFVNGSIDLLNNPDEHPAVDTLDKGIPHVHRLLYTHRTGHTLPAGDNGLGCQCINQVLSVKL